MDSREFDVKYLDNLVLPYDKQTKQLDVQKTRIVEGENTYITLGGKISRAPGLNDIGMTTYNLSNQPYRLLIYETIEVSRKVFLLASLKVGTLWSLYYIRLDAGAPAWTSVGTLRGVNVSAYPHEMVVANGKVYIRAVPSIVTNTQGTVIFDGSGAAPTLSPWGIEAPTTAARITAPAGWAASVNAVTVRVGWKYAYAWKSITGQYSARSPFETDPTVNESDTRAFTNKKPQVVVQGHADTTNYPKIGIFRTTDGGGTLYHLEDITNTGAGNITYTDNHRVAANTNNPKMDLQLDTSSIAPTLTSNLPPPPVRVGKVPGDQMDDTSSNIEYYAGRLWYFIGNRLFFSGQEEIFNGAPLESFPNPYGIRGNYFDFKGEGVSLVRTREALYFITTNEVGWIRGTDLQSFVVKTIDNFGGAKGTYGHKHATVAFRDLVFYLTRDFQVAVLSGDKVPQLISTPLGEELKTAIDRTLGGTGDTEVEFSVLAKDGKFWLIVSVVNYLISSESRQFVFDIERQIWFTPWKKKFSAIAFGKLRIDKPSPVLVVLTWNNLTNLGSLCFLDEAINTDAPGTTVISSYIILSAAVVPSGNHLNALRQPAHFPMLSYLLLEKTDYGDTNPTVQYRLDELSGAFTNATAFAPPYMVQRGSYKVFWYPIQLVCQKVWMKITFAAENAQYAVQNLGFVFQSEAGA